ncbi:MAG: PQQ-binding-like beta-propeller repeat protein [Chthonomonadales bacterium]|nr:PQQ-binding-like beta-propeller repeat protein [Chthonomonadales bacterium]
MTAILFAICALLSPAIRFPAVARFSFVHITDTHVPGAASVPAIRSLVQDVNGRSDRPAFIVNTGDATELGTEEEFTAYRAAVAESNVPVYAVPGNHDVRWSPLGKEAFTRSCGPLYRSFDHNGCHFVLLDSSVVLEHWGHFDGAQLSWLKSDLRKVRPATPIFVFLHHWFGRDKDNVDNADELLKILAPYNVVAAFIGHGHADIQWSVNGIACFMAKGLYQGSRHEITVEDGAATVVRISGGASGKREVVAVLPLVRPSRLVVRTRWLDSGEPLLARRRFCVALDRKATADLSVRWSVGGADMAGSSTVRAGASASPEASIDTTSLAAGWYTLLVRVEDQAGQAFTASEPFAVDRLDAPVRPVWERATASTIQGSPLLHDDTVYVGSFDGSVYAWDAASGRLRWKRPTGGAVFATPYVHGSTLIIASTDHRLYAMDARTGKLKWAYDSGTPLFATAAVSEGVAVVGGNRAIHGVDLQTGRARWSVPTGSFFQSRAAACEGRVVLGGWDNALYCIEAASGKVAWKREMGRTNGGRGRLSFYYSPAIASAAISNGRVYVCTNDGVLHCVRLDTGEDVWEARAPAGGDTFGYSSPLVADGRVFVGGLGDKGRGDCYALDAGTGALIWRASTGADNYDSSPTLAGDLVVIGSVSGRLTWMDPRDGAIVASYSPRPGFSFSTPTGTAALTYSAGMNGRLVAITTPARRTNTAMGGNALRD